MLDIITGTIVLIGIVVGVTLVWFAVGFWVHCCICGIRHLYARYESYRDFKELKKEITEFKNHEAK